MKQPSQQQQHKPGGGGVFGNFIMNQISNGMSGSSGWNNVNNSSNSGWGNQPPQQPPNWNQQPGWNQQPPNWNQQNNNGWPQPQQQPNQGGFGNNFIMNQLSNNMNSSGHQNNNNNGWGQQ